MVKGEFVNVGVVLTCGDGRPYADVRFATDWRRARCLDPEIDLDVLTELENELRDVLARGGADREWLTKRMEDTFSNSIQLSPVSAVLAESPEAELGILAQQYLEADRRGTRAISGRQAILRSMRSEFQKQGVWDYMFHDVKVAKYTHAGDPLKIDCSYWTKGTVRMFQAVSLETDVNAAKVLAFSYPELRRGMNRLEEVDPILTAIVEPELNEQDEKIAFALHAMRAQEINVRTIADLPRIAEDARIELKL